MKYTEENYEEYALDYLEDNLSEDDRAEFEVFLLLHPRIQDTINQFEWVTLEPDSSVVFLHKEKLIKNDGRRKIIFFNRRLLAVAATLLVVISIGLFLFRTATDLTDHQEVAVADNEVEIIPRSVPQQEMQIVVEEPVINSQKELLHRESLVENSLKPKGKQAPPRVRSLPEITPVVDQALLTKYIKEKNVLAEITNEEKTSQVDQARPRVLINQIDQRSFAFLPETSYHMDMPSMPLIVIDEDEINQEPGKFKKFLARANLLPKGLAENGFGNIREKLIPETFQGPK